MRLHNEKREELEEQQRHLHVGLDKLRDTVEQVEDLRKSLAIKRSQLEAKNLEANAKLKQMVADQQEAEQKKAASIEIQAALAQQDETIKQRREIVMADLADAEPAVLDAQSAVSNIKRQHLQEVRTMANPPEAVKLAMESVCTLLGHKIDSWRTVQGIIRRDDFIQRIVNFDTVNQLTKQLRDLMKRDFLSRPQFNFETVNRASKACGPLVKWAIAQVKFSEILDKVEPLRNEVQSLEDQAEATKKQASMMVTMIAELEASIERYKDEYAGLIRETEAIKAEMERVESKVDRSMKLLESLSSEKGRWESGSRTFDTEMGTIVGDVLLSAAFLAYAGFFDQQYREMMWQEWSTHLSDANVKFKAELSLPEYLSTADDRLSWQSKSLPSDNLCTENAIMIKRYSRYPLIIDPTGQATTFLLNEYKDRKITVTSFLDEAFLKVLESALRFGNTLLIQDVEHLDPILNPVLNREIRRTGGRVLIRLGNQDIDFSPSFTMFLSTRDPSVEFSPDICSRVTFVNFTMTRSSLQSQSLDQVLKVERPDTERKRTDLMKMQGEFRLRLRTLEKLLLQALNESSGNILDDDKVINTLETLKREAAEITRKVEETDIVMKEVEEVTAEYLPLAQACSAVFFILEQLNLVNHFYQFSLRFFLDIFDYVLLHNPNLAGITDYVKRREILINDLFLVVYKRTSRALLHRDHVMLAVLLAQVKLRGVEEITDELEFFLESGDGAVAANAEELQPSILTPDQAQRLAIFAKHSLFKPVLSHIVEHEDEWVPFLESTTPEQAVPSPWDPSTRKHASACDILPTLLTMCYSCGRGHPQHDRDQVPPPRPSSSVYGCICAKCVPNRHCRRSRVRIGQSCGRRDSAGHAGRACVGSWIRCKLPCGKFGAEHRDSLYIGRDGFSGGLHVGRASSGNGGPPRFMGFAQERTSGPVLAWAAGEEVADPQPTQELPPVPHHGGKPKYPRQHLEAIPHPHERTSSRYQGQPLGLVAEHRIQPSCSRSCREGPPILLASLVPCRCAGAASLRPLGMEQDIRLQRLRHGGCFQHHRHLAQQYRERACQRRSRFHSLGCHSNPRQAVCIWWSG